MMSYNRKWGQTGLADESRWRVGLYYAGGALLVLELILNIIALPATYWEQRCYNRKIR